ncbi:MAG: hypothetical protein PVI68_19700 [Anaerolineae bacterium]
MSRTKKVVFIGVPTILIACTLFGLILFAHYQPAVVPAPGYDVHWPTQPAGAWAAITKSYQSFLETRTCEYTVLGWSVESTLYYQETCEDGDPQTWTYDPDSENEPRAVEASPLDLLQQVVPRHAILEWVRVPQVRPADAEPSVRGLGVRVDGLASPDGRRVAVVVRHIYGPEDVLVLESEADGARLVDVPDYGLTELLQDLYAAGLAVEGTGMTVDYGFEIDGSQVLVEDSPIIVYEFENVAAAEEATTGVTADAGSVTVTRREGDLVREQHSDWFTEAPHLFKKGRLIVIARDHAEVLRALEAILGPQFAGG